MSGTAGLDAESRGELQRAFDERVACLRAAYEARLRGLGEALLTDLRLLDTEGALASLARDPATRPHVLSRLDDALTRAARDEREAALKTALGQLADERARVATLQRQLEQTGSQSASASLESAHRSSLALSAAQAQVNRLEAALRDATREAEISRASEAVYKEELAKLQAHVATLDQQLSRAARECDDLRLRLQNESEQLALAREHAREAALNAQLAEQTLRSKLSTREAVMQAELDALRAELAAAGERHRRELEAQLSHLQSTSTHDSLIALNKLRQEGEEREQKLREQMQAQIEQLQSQLSSEAAAHAQAERDWMTRAEEQRRSLEEQHRAQVESISAAHADALRDQSQAHTLEMGALVERANEAQLERARVQAALDSAEAKAQTERSALEVRYEKQLAELNAQILTLSDKLAAAQAALENAHAEREAKRRTDASDRSEWRDLTDRYNDVLLKYHALSCSASTHAATIQTLTHERDTLRTRFAALGEKVETLLAGVESGVARTVAEEESKRDALKSQYADERQKWKREKSALLETVSLSEKKLLDMQALVKSLEEKLVDATAQRQSAESTIAQLRADIDTLQSHRRSMEEQLSDRVHQIDKLLLERTHVADFQQAAVRQVNAEREQGVARVESELQRRLESASRDAEARVKDMAAQVERERLGMELEKAEAFRRGQSESEARWAEERRSLFTAEQMEARVARMVDERVASIAKGLVHPHQHEAIIAAKLAALQSKLQLEHDRAMQSLREQHDKALADADSRHARQLEELRLKFEAEYAAHVERARAGLQDVEARLARERREAEEGERKQAARETREKELESEVRAMQARVETMQLNEQRLLSHVASQSGVIDKLKALLDAEKARVADMPGAERRALLQQMEELQQRVATERAALQRNHDEQMASLQQLLDTEKKIVKQLNEERESREAEFRSRESSLDSSHRAGLDSLSSRYSASLAALEERHAQLWAARETNWQRELAAREHQMQAKIGEWEVSYKAEIAAREKRVQSLQAELAHERDQNSRLQSEVDELQRQLRDSVAVLQQHTARLTRTGAHIRHMEQAAI